MPGIHAFASPSKKDVDGRDKPGHDEKRLIFGQAQKDGVHGVIA
jgi:hypothetical protein